MRLILILIVIVAIFALVQSKRHDCEFNDGWLDCVIDKTSDEFSAKTEPPASDSMASETSE
jgi:hypothetical protein